MRYTIKGSVQKLISQYFHLYIKITVNSDFKGERVKYGHRRQLVLSATFPDKTQIKDANTANAFAKIIRKIGVDKVKCLDIKHGGKPLIDVV